MKNILTILFLCGSIALNAQVNTKMSKIDSLSNISRLKADNLLKQINNSNQKTILYSIGDEHYFLIVDNNKSYREYYLKVDSQGKIVIKRPLKSSSQSKQVLPKAFEISSYRTDFITTVSNPRVVQGKHSYFVLKDTDGKRYGEYWLSVLTVPIPIEKKLYDYLVTRLLKESTND